MADILIRGMEMPEERSLWLCIKTDGTVYNIKPGGVGTAHAVGTAVPLPEKHGRLGDLDALCRLIANNSRIDGIIAAGIISYINAAHTIVPAEGGTENG